RPLLDIIERQFVPLRDRVEWGYTIPYAITGLLDEHPRTAMALRAGVDKDKYLEFYEKLTTVETHGAHL
ncbi:MAG: nucleoid-structuring protein H-NS, partial [Bacilli bacterium]